MRTKPRRAAGTHSDLPTIGGSLTIRRSCAADAAAIERLAQLDSQHAPSGDFLQAEVSGELVAAVALDHSQAIADPVRHTDHIVRLLRLSPAQADGRRSPLYRARTACAAPPADTSAPRREPMKARGLLERVCPHHPIANLNA